MDITNRYTAIVFSLILTAGFVVGLFMEPAESRANLTAGWKGEYFDNISLEGDPLIVDADEIIEMNWFTAAPYEEMPADYFSVRWTSTASFGDGVYRFRVGADDGIRLLIDGKVIIDAFEPGTFRTFTRDVRLKSGEHDLLVEYFEATGFAGVLVDWALTADTGEVIDLETETIDIVEADDTPPLARVRGVNSIVYDRPHIQAGRVTQVSFYQQLPVLGVSEDGNWVQIGLHSDLSGWVLRADVAFADDADLARLEVPAGSQTIPAEFVGEAQADLTILDVPQGHEALGTIPDAEAFEIIGRDASGAWLLIRLESDKLDPLEGWVYAPYVHITSGNLLDLTIR